MTLGETVEWFESVYDVNSVFTPCRDSFICIMDSDRLRVYQDYEIVFGLTTCNSIATAHLLIGMLSARGFNTKIANEGVYVFITKNKG